jgi:tetratricopeptide (TPR) repeat protein
MSQRSSSTFAPKSDKFTSFSKELSNEVSQIGNVQNSSWFSNAAKLLFGTVSKEATSNKQFHELMVHALQDDRSNINKVCDGDLVDKYVVSYLPKHLIRAQMYFDASKLLVDQNFIRRRIETLGAIDASQHHMFDLVELRRSHHTSKSGKSTETATVLTVESGLEQGQSEKIDSSKIVREGSRRLIEAVRADCGDNIDVAICLACVGENLLRAKQTKESILRLTETVRTLQNLLGNEHLEVARSMYALAKAHIKAGDDQSALANLNLASKIYTSCNSTQSYNAITNNQLIANIFVDKGDWEMASAKFEEVIQSKVALYGEISLPVAKTLNDYAIILAKHSRMSEALRRYDTARTAFEKLNLKCEEDSNEIGNYSFDVTLIDLNIASIKSKLADYQGALESYERGVAGLRLHMQREVKGSELVDENRLTAEKKHLVSAIGRIGSLRMKLRDNSGALEAYLILLKEVDSRSPESSRMEKAKALVKCATIYRQMGGPENNLKATSHLKKSLDMYTALYGVDHKDTKAISSSLKQWLKADAESGKS